MLLAKLIVTTGQQIGLTDVRLRPEADTRLEHAAFKDLGVLPLKMPSCRLIGRNVSPPIHENCDQCCGTGNDCEPIRGQHDGPLATAVAPAIPVRAVEVRLVLQIEHHASCAQDGSIRPKHRLGHMRPLQGMPHFQAMQENQPNCAFDRHGQAEQNACGHCDLAHERSKTAERVRPICRTTANSLLFLRRVEARMGLDCHPKAQPDQK